MTISNRIFDLLSNQNKSQKALSEFTGIKTNTISDWKTKGTNPSSDKIKRICEFFDVTTDWLLTGEGSMIKSDPSAQHLPPDEILNRPEPPPVPDEMLHNLLTVDEHTLLNHYRDMPNARKLDIQRTAAQMAAGRNVVILRRPDTEGAGLKQTEAKQTKLKQTEEKQIKTKQTGLKKTEPFDGDQPKKIAMREYTLSASAGFGNYLDGDSPYNIITVYEDEVPHGAEFGVRITGDSMEPRIRNGSIAWVKQQVAVEDGDIGIFIVDNESFCKQLHIDYENRVVKLVSLNKQHPTKIIRESEDIRTVGKVLGTSFF